jgi:hypothetical protein
MHMKLNLMLNITFNPHGCPDTKVIFPQIVVRTFSSKFDHHRYIIMYRQAGMARPINIHVLFCLTQQSPCKQTR